MHNFKKVFISMLSIILIILISSIGLFGYIEVNQLSISDEKLERLSYSGNIDFVVIGASHAQCAFTPTILDEELGCFSYNLSQNAIINEQKYMLLESELNHNPIKTVVIEISYDTLIRESKISATYASIFFTKRLDNFEQRMLNLFKYTSGLDNYMYVYSDLMLSSIRYGIFYSKKNMLNEDFTNSLKGGCLLEQNNYTLLPESVSQMYNINDIFSNTDIKKCHLNSLNDTIALCKKHNCRVIISVVPVSDNFLWQQSNLDNFRIWIKDYCDKNNVELYDFNLSKERYKLFSDENSYSTDTCHMSKIGAPVFTKLFCEIINKVDDGKDISDEFYDSYEIMKSESPYWKYMY